MQSTDGMQFFKSCTVNETNKSLGYHINVSMKQLSEIFNMELYIEIVHATVILVIFPEFLENIV